VNKLLRNFRLLERDELVSLIKRCGPYYASNVFEGSCGICQPGRRSFSDYGSCGFLKAGKQVIFCHFSCAQSNAATIVDLHELEIDFEDTEAVGLPHLEFTPVTQCRFRDVVLNHTTMVWKDNNGLIPEKYTLEWTMEHGENMKIRKEKRKMDAEDEHSRQVRAQEMFRLKRARYETAVREREAKLLRFVSPENIERIKRSNLAADFFVAKLVPKMGLGKLYRVLEEKMPGVLKKQKTS